MSVQIPFLPLRKDDLEEETLFRLNYIINTLIEEIARLQGVTGKTVFRGEVEAKGFRIGDSNLITREEAERLFGPEAIREAWSRKVWQGRPVRGISARDVGIEIPDVGALPMPDVPASDEKVVDRGGLFGFSGSFLFPVGSENYENLAGIEVTFWGPVDEQGNDTQYSGPHIMGIVEAPRSESNPAVTWTSDFWPRPSETEYYVIRYTKISVRGDRVRNDPRKSGVLAVHPLSVVRPTPDVMLFKAGTALPDGSWQEEMRWDETSTRLVVDWGVIAPSDRTNWYGVALWIRTPLEDGQYLYHQASGVMDVSVFRETHDGDLFYFGQHIVEASDIPVTPTLWRFIAVSYGMDKKAKRDSEGNPTGPYVDLLTLPDSDVVLNFRVDVDYEFSDSSGWMYRFYGSWDNPHAPRFKGVRIVADFPYAQDVELATELEGSTEFTTDWWPAPADPMEVDVYAQTYYGVDSYKDKSESPKVTVTVEPPRGDLGQEFAPLVTDASAEVWYGQDHQKNLIYWYEGSYRLPDPLGSYRGLRIFERSGTPAKDRLIASVPLADESAGSVVEFKTSTHPAPPSPTEVELWFVSVDSAGRRNSIVPGTTPRVRLTVGYSIGSPGQEYAPYISNPTVTVQKRFTETQTYKSPGGVEVWRLNISWSLPSDVSRYSGCAIYVTFPGENAAEKPRLVAREQHPNTKLVTDEWPVPASPTTVTVWFVSYWGEHENTVNTAPMGQGGTPRVEVSLSPSAPGKIYGPNIEDLPIAAFASTIRPVALVSEWPTNIGPGTHYPEGTFAFHTVEKKLKRVAKQGSNWVWREAIDGTADVVSRSITAGSIAAGAIGTTELYAGEIRVGGGGGKPGQFGVYNDSNQKIGWIGTESGQSGAWFKQLWVGGTQPSNAKMYTDASGNLYISDGSISVSAQGHRVFMNPNDQYAPFRVTQTQNPSSEARLSSTEIKVGSYQSLQLGSAMWSDGLHSSIYATAVGLTAFRAKLDTDAQDVPRVELHVGILDLARWFEVKVNRYTDQNAISVADFKNMDIQVTAEGGVSKKGISQDISYEKPGGGSGTLKFRRGILVEAT